MEAMANAVDSSGVIIVAISRGYHDSANCKREIGYAHLKKKQVLYVLLDRDYEVDGWLAVMMGQALYVDARNGIGPSELTQIINQVRIMLGETSPAQTGSAAAPSGASQPAPSVSKQPSVSNVVGSSAVDNTKLDAIAAELAQVKKQVEVMSSDMKAMREMMEAMTQLMKKKDE